mmetsp:Transcript_32481/g.73341  ORF Transcript_32481/g.73341 Transcript_32481/m.73341 type:complete len:82 (-) Transcript_32481:515-760(-)
MPRQGTGVGPAGMHTATGRRRECRVTTEEEFLSRRLQSPVGLAWLVLLLHEEVLLSQATSTAPLANQEYLISVVVHEALGQ